MQYKTEILATIRKTREISLPSWGKVRESSLKGLSPASVVTHIDKEIEQYLAAAFAAIDPTISFVGEEYGGNREASRFWLCDPIDGTGHYVRGTPFSTTMVSLIENGQVTFSAIYDFVNDVLYHAVRGGGAWQDDQPLHVGNRTRNDAYLVLETKLEKPENMALYLKLREKSCMVNLVCSGYEHVMLAKGTLDCRICVDGYGQDYDFAPGSLLVEEAGGVVTNIGSPTYDYRNTNYIATNPAIYESLTQGSDALFPLQ